MIHRDLKSANILLDGSRLAISDFGLSRPYEVHKQEFTAETGSYRWMAPEVTRHEPYDEKFDMYSYACLAYEMVSYRRPFDSMTVLEAAFAVARDGLRPELPVSCPPLIATLIRQCWAQRSEDRPSFTDVYRRLEEIKNTSTRHKIAESQVATSPSPTPSVALPSTPSLLHSTAQEGSSTARNSEPKRKIESEQTENPSESPKEGGLKRPKSISSALVDLQVGGI